MAQNERYPDDLNNLDNRNDSDNVRGRVLRRQTGSPSQKLSDEVDVTTPVSSNKVPSTSSRKREGTVSPDTSNSNNTSEQDIDHQGNEVKSKKSRKTVTFDGTEANASAANSESDTSKRFRTAAQLAREQRSRRRQAAQGTDGLDPSVAVSVSRKQDNRSTHKKKVPGSSAANNSTETDANIVRVPMRTGTLILYQGSHRRAVFIRRV